MVQGLTEPLFQNFFQKKVWQRDYDNMKKQCGAKLLKMCINDLTSVEFSNSPSNKRRTPADIFALVIMKLPGFFSQHEFLS